TGYVYITTRQKINEILCNRGDIPFTPAQLAEIAAFRSVLLHQKAVTGGYAGPLADGPAPAGIWGTIKNVFTGGASTEKSATYEDLEGLKDDMKDEEIATSTDEIATSSDTSFLDSILEEEDEEVATGT